MFESPKLKQEIKNTLINGITQNNSTETLNGSLDSINSTMNNSTMNNSTMNNSTMNNSIMNNSTMNNSTMNNSIMNNSTSIMNNSIMNNSIMNSSTLFIDKLNKINPIDKLTKSKIIIESKIFNTYYYVDSNNNKLMCATRTISGFNIFKIETEVRHQLQLHGEGEEDNRRQLQLHGEGEGEYLLREGEYLLREGEYLLREGEYLLKEKKRSKDPLDNSNLIAKLSANVFGTKYSLEEIIIETSNSSKGNCSKSSKGESSKGNSNCSKSKSESDNKPLRDLTDIVNNCDYTPDINKKEIKDFIDNHINGKDSYDGYANKANKGIKDFIVNHINNGSNHNNSGSNHVCNHVCNHNICNHNICNQYADCDKNKKILLNVEFDLAFLKKDKPRSFEVFLNHLVLINKKPIYNPETNNYSLNFTGRVTVASVKNFQIVHPLDPTFITLTFGKESYNSYILDWTHPWSALKAFCVGLTALDHKLGFE